MLKLLRSTLLRTVVVWACASLPLCHAHDFEAHSTAANAAPLVIRLPRLDVRSALSVPPNLAAYHGAAEYLPNSEDFESDLKPSTWSAEGFRVVPYGRLWGNMAYATQRTNPGPYTLYVFSSAAQGEPAYSLDARGSRVGIDVQGPLLTVGSGLKNRARVEVDFLGAFLTENTAGVRLRHAYWEVSDDTYRLLVGQNWDVISPLYPGLLNLAVGWYGGNLGFRRAQFRAERYFQPSDNLKIALQGSLNQDIVPDFPDEPGVRRESVAWPVIEGRVGFTWRRNEFELLDTTIGVSGHIGQTGFDFLEPGPPPTNLPPDDDGRFLTWSFNVDLRVPITERFGVQGEFFTGANLSSFLGGIGQGVCPCLRVPIRSTGGWVDLWYDWTARLHSHAGFGLDDPNNRDFLFGRTYNQFMFANLNCDITKKFSTGIEISYWKTLYQERRTGQIPDDQLQASAPGKSLTIDWIFQYDF